MSGSIVKSIVWGNCLLFVVLSLAWPAEAEETKALYPNMAPLEQYLMSDRNAEVALARTAAPTAISQDAKILVLGRNGYETAVEGKNGFVCAVERSWGAGFDNSEFWNPKNRSPICFNPEAARSVLPLYLNRTKMVLAGVPKAQMIARIKISFEKKELPAIAPGSICFMMSKEAYLTDSGSHNLAHLMFEVPRTEGAALGADVANSPIIVGSQDDVPEPMTEMIVPVGKWSDGTAAPTD